MSTTMYDWSDVRRGWVVKDKTGTDWTVVGVSGGSITISTAGRRDHTAVRTGQVAVVSRPAPQADPEVDRATAMGLMAVKFGAVEVGKQGRDKTKPWACPPDFDDPGALLAHLRIFHGAMSDEPSLAGLRKEHAALHHPDQKGEQYDPHVHEPDYESL